MDVTLSDGTKSWKVVWLLMQLLCHGEVNPEVLTARQKHNVIMTPNTYLYLTIIRLRIQKQNRWLSEVICLWKEYIATSQCRLP